MRHDLPSPSPFPLLSLSFLPFPLLLSLKGVAARSQNRTFSTYDGLGTGTVQH